MKKTYISPVCNIEHTQAFEVIATSMGITTDKADKDYEGGCDGRQQGDWSDIWNED